MLVVSRFRYAADDMALARRELGTCLGQLARCTGFRDGVVGRAVDDESLWVVQTRWEHVGAYRRAVASYEVKLHAVPLLSRALDEPSAYEIVVGDDATVPNVARPRES